ncbi:MAG: hypothetical protein AAFY31_05875, partial [Pseudomonadota bacterium]
MKQFSPFAIGIVGIGFAAIHAAPSLAQNAAVANVEALEATRTNLRRDRNERQMRAKRGRGLQGELFRDVFDAADANADGAVTPDEVEAYRAARIGEVDASGDGALSIEEFDELYRS